MSLAICCICSAALADSAATPDTAYTVRDDVEIRSGPGTEFYVTQRLPAGTLVEIYRHQGEWEAIRPPAGSFCWLPSDSLSWREGDDIAHTTQEVRTRIGSLVSDTRNVAYVTLPKGEAVRLLSQDPSLPKWCRIEPPAGEFRWIHRDDVSSEYPRTDDPDVAETAPRSSSSADTPEVDPLDDSARSLRESLAAIRETMQTMLPELNDPAPDPSRVVLASADEPSVTELTDDSSPAAPQTFPVDRDQDPGLLPYPGPPASAPRASSPGLAGELTKIAADLSSQVSRAPSIWELGSLRRQAQTVIDVSETAEVREQGTRLLARIAQFEDIQRRHRLLDRTAASLAKNRPTANGGLASAAGSQPPVDVSEYDGFGWLMPVVTQNRRVPRYVLTDQQGNILQFVTPSPGLNLSRYAHQKVGIYGTRGFLPSMKQPHLVAERIVSMDSVR
jgi:SH3-like domain-containing protein